MQAQLTWKVTAGFMVGWSPGSRSARSVLRYFGEDLVAYRDESGELHMLSGHCRHLGAHIGHGGKVVGDCVECPFHGWRWGPDGTNRYIPYQPDRPNRALRLRVFPVREQYDCVFIWHQPDGKEPQWEIPGHLPKVPAVRDRSGDYYRAYPEFSRRAAREPVHPQIVAENAPDSAHFEYVHHATVTPRVLDWKIVDHEWQFIAGWPDAQRQPPRSRGRFHSHLFGLGGAISVFEGAQNHRLIFTCTPVDDECSDLFYSIWWPRVPGDTADVPRASSHSSKNSSCQLSSTIWRSGATSGTWKTRHSPGTTRKGIWHCVSGRLSSTRYHPPKCRGKDDRAGRARGARAHGDRHPGVSGRSHRPQRGTGSARRRSPPHRVAQHRAAVAGGAGAAGVRIVHCLVQRRPDGLSSNHNAKIFTIGAAPTSTSPLAHPGPPCCPN